MWFYEALLAALIYTLVIILNKKLVKDFSPLFLVWVATLISIPFTVPFMGGFKIPAISTAFLAGIFLSVAAYVTTTVLRLKAFKLANLSQIFPLISISSIFTLIFAMFPPLLEKPTTLSVIGVLITVLGVYMLHMDLSKRNVLEPFVILFKNKASLLVLVSAVISATTIIFDKIAIDNTLPPEPIFTLQAENLLLVIIFLPVLLLNRDIQPKKIMLQYKWLLLMGVLLAASAIVGFFAISAANVGYISAIYKTEIIFVLLFSWIFFKDKPKKEIWLGTIIALFGVVLIKFGS